MCLQRQDLDIRTVNAVIEEITQEVQANQEDKPPREKLQTCILLSDPSGRLNPEFFEAAGFSDFTGWVVKIPEEESPATVHDRIRKAAYDFNVTPKGRRMPVLTVGEAAEVVPARIFKEHGIRIQTKEPVLILTTDNRIPRDEGI
jgi:hypothetical protein